MATQVEPLCQYFDHTNLKITATNADIEKLCSEAKQYSFAAVCIQPCYVALCKKLLENTKVKICTVIGFPNGYHQTNVKVFEAKQAVLDGAEELDLVINICKAKNGDWDYVESEIRQVVKACPNSCVKVIIETD